MPVNLTKGQSVNLTKEAPGLKAVVAGAGWDVAESAGSVDLDLMAFALNSEGKCASDDGAIYFNQLKNAAGTIQHTGDNRTGDGDGDDEQIKIDLAGLDASIAKVALVLHSFSGQDLSVVQNAFARVVNQDGNTELTRFALTGGTSGKTLYMGEFVRNGAEWEFKATGDYTSEEIKAVFSKYGINA